MNVKANQSILQLDCIDDAFFCPAASDEGLAVGAALRGYAELELQNGHKPIKIPLVSNYFGSSFTNEQIIFYPQNFFYTFMNKLKLKNHAKNLLGSGILNQEHLPPLKKAFAEMLKET